MKSLYCILILIFTGEKQIALQPGFKCYSNMTEQSDKSYTFLCLGDSYTIGEGVPFFENFPSQVVQMARKSGIPFQAPEIVAKTGWTTDELQAAIKKHQFLASYDFVTLLIGVNNQYRNLSIKEYESEFESLLKDAIAFAGGKRDHVIVLSIPDWGITPFAAGRDSKKITDEIDSFNNINKMIAEKFKTHRINITPGTREAANDSSLITSDGLHPSAKEYTRWAEKIFSIIRSSLSKQN